MKRWVLVACVLFAGFAQAQGITCSEWVSFKGDVYKSECKLPDGGTRIGWALWQNHDTPPTFLLALTRMADGTADTTVVIAFTGAVNDALCPQPIGVILEAADGTKTDSMVSGCGQQNWLVIFERDASGAVITGYELNFVRRLASAGHKSITFVAVTSDGETTMQFTVPAAGLDEAAAEFLRLYAEYTKQ